MRVLTPTDVTNISEQLITKFDAKDLPFQELRWCREHLTPEDFALIKEKITTSILSNNKELQKSILTDKLDQLSIPE